MCSGSESEKFSGIENDKENRIDQEKGHSVQDSKGRCSHSQQLQTNRGNEGHCRRAVQIRLKKKLYRICSFSMDPSLINLNNYIIQ